jgi:hypothetical protein
LKREPRVPLGCADGALDAPSHALVERREPRRGYAADVVVDELRQLLIHRALEEPHRSPRRPVASSSRRKRRRGKVADAEATGHPDRLPRRPHPFPGGPHPRKPAKPAHRPFPSMMTATCWGSGCWRMASRRAASSPHGAAAGPVESAVKTPGSPAPSSSGPRRPSAWTGR